MSAATVIVCDHCGERSHPRRRVTIGRLRSLLRWRGWRYWMEGGKRVDVCPACVRREQEAQAA